MKKSNILLITSLVTLAVASASIAVVASKKNVVEAEGYSTSSLPTTIDLNDVSSSNVRSYYSSLNDLSQSERQGTNLLKNLKTILKNGQKYYSYDSGNAIWQIYEIADRDWDKSPASSTSYGTYNSSTNKITGYTYGTSSSSSKNNPYIHALYINRDVTNQTTAWDDHQQTQWGINREHVWPKAEGFEESGAGGARGDPMHLMAGNGYANNIHSNYYYGYVDTSSSYTNCGSTYSNISGNLRGKSKTLGGSTNVFEPQDCDKGDIARAIFYMVARYNYLSNSDSDGIDSNNPNLALTQSLSDWASSGYSSTTSTTGKMGIMTDLLRWHKIDPVDEYEIHRNNLLYTNYTNNRNPFIDFPEWADYIWGTTTYSGTTYQSYSSTPTGYAKPSSDTINGYNSGSSTVDFYTTPSSVSLVVGGEDASVSVTASGGSGTPSWTSGDTSVATVSGTTSLTITPVGEGTTTITGTYSGVNTTIDVTVSTTAPVAETDVTIEKDDYTPGYASSGTSGTISKTVSSANDLSISYSGINTKSSGGSAYAYTMYAGGNGYIYSTTCPSGYYPSKVTVSFTSGTGESGKAGITYGTSQISSKQTVTGAVTKSGTCELTNSNPTKLYWNFSTNTSNVQVSSITVTYSEITSTDYVTLNKNSLSLNIGESETLQATASGSVTWSSDATTIATVNSSGKVTAVGEGTAFITATSGTAEATCTVTVLEPVTLSYISVSGQTTSFTKNGTFSFGGTVTAHYSDDSTEDVTASATFSGYDLSTTGNQTVTVTYSGETTTYQITVSESGGGSTAAGTFTVNLQDKSLKDATSYQNTQTTTDYDGGDATASLAWSRINPNSGQISGNSTTLSNLQSGTGNFYIHNTDPLPGNITSITISGIDGTVTASNAYAMTASSAISSQTTDSSTAGTSGTNAVTWSFNENSSGKYFALGCVKGFTSGNVYATSFIVEYAASSGGDTTPKINSVTISPDNYEVSMGATKTITPVVSGENNPNKALTWTSSNTSVATVSNGVVTPVGAGTTTITATSVLDPTKADTATVKVNSASLTSGSPYMNGVAYKLFFVNSNSVTRYFSGGMSGNYGGSVGASSIDNSPDIYFEASSSGQNIYFLSEGVKNYISVIQSGTYYNFSYGTSVPSTQWIYDSANSCLTYALNDNNYVLGSSGTYNTIGTYKVANVTIKCDFVTSDTSGEYGFATVFMNSITCDSNGKNAPTFNNGTSWSSLSAVYAKLSETSKATFVSTSPVENSSSIIEQAAYRYDYIVGKYGTGTYNDFASRSPASIGVTNSFLFASGSSDSLMAILVIVLMLGLTGVVAYVYIRRRETN